VVGTHRPHGGLDSGHLRLSSRTLRLGTWKADGLASSPQGVRASRLSAAETAAMSEKPSKRAETASTLAASQPCLLLPPPPKSLSSPACCLALHPRRFPPWSLNAGEAEVAEARQTCLHKHSACCCRRRQASAVRPAQGVSSGHIAEALSWAHQVHPKSCPSEASLSRTESWTCSRATPLVTIVKRRSSLVLRFAQMDWKGGSGSAPSAGRLARWVSESVLELAVDCQATTFGGLSSLVEDRARLRRTQSGLHLPSLRPRLGQLCLQLPPSAVRIVRG
jgi:hypothetical protein